MHHPDADIRPRRPGAPASPSRRRRAAIAFGWVLVFMVASLRMPMDDGAPVHDAIGGVVASVLAARTPGYGCGIGPTAGRARTSASASRADAGNPTDAASVRAPTFVPVRARRVASRGPGSLPIVLGLARRTDAAGPRPTSPAAPSRKTSERATPERPRAAPGGARPRGRAGDAVLGVDISHWNGIVPFARVREAGRRFAFMKATQGTGFVDHTYVRQLANARATGILTGAYHFFDYRVGGAAQARHFLDVVSAAGGLEGSLPPVVDLECFGPLGAAHQATVRRELRAFVDTIERRIGRPPIIYTSAHIWDQLTGGDPTFGATPLWVACWGCSVPRLPTGWDRWTFWQTGAVRIPGMKAKIGADRYAGDIEALRRLVGPAFTVRGSGRTTNQRDVDLRFVGLNADRYRVRVDDEAWGRWRTWRGSVRVRLPDADGDHVIRFQGRTRREGRGPVFRHRVRLDRRPPEIEDLRPLVALGPMGSDTVRLEAYGSVAGLGRTGTVEVAAHCAGEPVAIPLGDGTARARPPDDGADGAIRLDQACRLVGVATDASGNAAISHADAMLQLTTRVSDRGPGPGGTSDAVRLRFRGVGAAVVASREAGAGSFDVRLDGRSLGRMDLGADRASEPEVVLSLHLPEGSDQEHVLELRPRADDGAGPSDDVISFIVLTAGQA